MPTRDARMGSVILSLRKGYDIARRQSSDKKIAGIIAEELHDLATALVYRLY